MTDKQLPFQQEQSPEPTRGTQPIFSEHQKMLRRKMEARLEEGVLQVLADANEILHREESDSPRVEAFRQFVIAEAISKLKAKMHYQMEMLLKVSEKAHFEHIYAEEKAKTALLTSTQARELGMDARPDSDSDSGANAISTDSEVTEFNNKADDDQDTFAGQEELPEDKVSTIFNPVPKPSSSPNTTQQPNAGPSSSNLLDNVRQLETFTSTIKHGPLYTSLVRDFRNTVQFPMVSHLKRLDKTDAIANRLESLHVSNLHAPGRAASANKLSLAEPKKEEDAYDSDDLEVQRFFPPNFDPKTSSSNCEPRHFEMITREQQHDAPFPHPCRCELCIPSRYQ